MGKKDYARAILEFRNAARLLPNSAEAAYQLSLAYLDSGDYGSGVAHAKRHVLLRNQPKWTVSSLTPPNAPIRRYV